MERISRMVQSAPRDLISVLFVIASVGAGALVMALMLQLVLMFRGH